MDYIALIQEWAASIFNYYIPDPNEWEFESLEKVDVDNGCIYATYPFVNAYELEKPGESTYIETVLKPFIPTSREHQEAGMGGFTPPPWG